MNNLVDGAALVKTPFVSVDEARARSFTCKVCLGLREMGTKVAMRIAELERKLKEEAESRQASEESVERDRLRKKEEWKKSLALEKLGRREDLAR